VDQTFETVSHEKGIRPVWLEFVKFNTAAHFLGLIKSILQVTLQTSKFQSFEQFRPFFYEGLDNMQFPLPSQPSGRQTVVCKFLQL
jgi:hypothetical protein